MLENYTSDYIETILQKFAVRTIESGKVSELEDEYPDPVRHFMGAVTSVITLPSITFHAALLQLGAEQETRHLLSKNRNFVQKFEALLDDPSQDDFYGTEGWEHYLGLD